MNKVDRPTTEARTVLSEVLPFEVPPNFSNRAFYKFLVANKVRVESSKISWPVGNDGLDRLMKLMMNFPENEPLSGTSQGRHGLARKRYSIPFKFTVGRGEHSSRTLAIPHPIDQVLVADFYARYRSLILHYTSLSEYSMRHPSAISRYTVVKDRLHERLKGAWGEGIEVASREAVIFQSYFRYERYGNIYKFYESEHIQELEKRFQNLLRLDIAKCFESIYTHSIAWAIYGKANVKQSLGFKNRVSSFGESFDELMQSCNYNETNGILVGPEFSRLFAEVILQAVDQRVHHRLSQAGLTHRRDYEIQRYVDDYFVFSDRDADELFISKVIQEELLAFNLHFNGEKRVSTRMPDVTPISIAKLRVSALLAEKLRFSQLDTDLEIGVQNAIRLDLSARTFITEYKTILKETGAAPQDIVNYILSVVERRVVALLQEFSAERRVAAEQDSLMRGLAALVRFVFYAFAGSPRVNPTVKLARIATHLIAFADSKLVGSEDKSELFDLIYQEIVGHLSKSRMAESAQVENLFLLNVLTQLGRSYLLPEGLLLDYFSIKSETSELEFPGALNHFSVTTLLGYIQNRRRYARLKRAIEFHVLEIVDGLANDSAERVMLILDLSVCPYLSDVTKMKLLSKFGLKRVADRVAVQKLHDEWFVRWGRFDLGDELDLKRNQEVY